PDVELSVIIPAYNEERNIERTIQRATESLRSLVGRFEIILIDDCSSDHTLRLAETLATQHPELRVVRNQRNLRQGGSLRRGFALARYPLVTHNAMDYPFDFENLPSLLDRFPGADVVVASRKTYPGTSVPRRFVSLGYRVLLRATFGVPVRDYNFV